MKLPRSVSGADLVKALKRLGYEVTRQTALGAGLFLCGLTLKRLGYEVTRQTGSHVRLTLQQPKQYHVTVPNHDPIKIGTLAAIITDVSTQMDIPRDKLIRQLFG